MGNVPGGMGGEFNPNDPNNNDPKKDGEGEKKKKKRFEPRPAASGRNGRRRRRKGPSGLNKTPTVMPTSKCKLRLLKLDRVKGEICVLHCRKCMTLVAIINMGSSLFHDYPLY